MGTYQHVHIGPGKLALGLIRPIVSGSKKNINTIFLARSPQAPERKKYYDALQQGEYDLEITLASARYRSAIEGFQLQFLDSLPSNPISDSKTVLLTTAVGRDNLESIAGFIAQGLRNRQKNSYPLFVLACENLPDNSHCLERLVKKAGRLKLQKPQGIYFLNTVVDRICPEPRIEQRNKQDYVVQPAEHFYEWVINGSNLPDDHKELLHDLLPETETIIITDRDEEFKFFEFRKAFLVNGIHLAIATLAYGVQPTLDKALKEEDAVLEAVLGIQEGFGIGLYYHCEEEGLFRTPIPHADPVRIKEFNMKTLIRIEDAPKDTPERILRDCLEWSQLKERLKAISQAGRKLTKDELENLLKVLLADLSTFLKKSIERVSEPVKVLVDADKRIDLIRKNPQIATGILQFFCRYLELLRQTVDEFYLEQIKEAIR